MDLDMLRTFLIVADAGSLSAAARRLELPVSTISRRIAGLELELGAALLERTGRGVRMLPAGERFVERTRASLRELELGVSEARSGRGLGPDSLAIAAPLELGLRLLPLALAEFARRHAALELRVVSESRRAALLEEQLDLALRIGKLGDSSLIARPLGHIGLVACAAPAFVRARGREAIERWDRIVVAEPARVDDQSGRTIRVSTFSEAAALAEGELGWTVLPSYTAVPALEREGLIVIKGAPEREPAPLHGLFAARHRNAADPIGLLLRELCEDVTQQLAGVEAKLARLRGRRRKS